MKVLFVGDGWLGSSARGLGAALARRDDLLVDEVMPDLIVPQHRALPLRAASRLLAPLHRRELTQRVLQSGREFRPDVVVFYKAPGFSAEFLQLVQREIAPIVNVFPDHSPHVYGPMLREAVGVFDLVISAKPFHPAQWATTYGYRNRCVFTPHGYDPRLHLRPDPVTAWDFDVGLVATWRQEYEDLLTELAAIPDIAALRFAVVGPYWKRARGKLPPHWVVAPNATGMTYVEWVRRSKIMLAPVQRIVRTADGPHPGDVDSTRTYELAAAHTFFVHKRTDFVATVYDEAAEVPFYDGAEDLADIVRRYLTDDARRAAMAGAAHRRAVPAYSLDARAAEVVGHLRALLEGQTP